MFSPRPGGGTRDAKPKPCAASLGQTRAICPKWPQFYKYNHPTKKIHYNRSARAYVAFLVGALKAERWTFRLDVAYATARVTLFGCDAARLGACR